MKVTLAAVGRLKEPYLVAAEDDYRKRLRPYCTLAIVEVKDEPALLAALPQGARLYAFDERGEAITLPPSEAETYLADVTSAIPAVLAKDAQMKLDYETMMAAGKKYQ